MTTSILTRDKIYRDFLIYRLYQWLVDEVYVDLEGWYMDASVIVRPTDIHHYYIYGDSTAEVYYQGLVQEGYLQDELVIFHAISYDLLASGYSRSGVLL